MTLLALLRPLPRRRLTERRRWCLVCATGFRPLLHKDQFAGRVDLSSLVFLCRASLTPIQKDAMRAGQRMSITGTTRRQREMRGDLERVDRAAISSRATFNTS